ncbi:QsdR family transcriptional regulator [Saccharothrix xinjiangensis]|uniref:QsdR family transcriptional regulator n=1 Tax=Saccharothrix xinjiangensis TaxID=204798 RepID=A0ABV9Y6E3_9PSEU
MADDARRVVTGEQVVLGACELFLRHGGVDMERLAASLAISRATLYRVVRGRDGLLGDVLWLLADRVLARARQRRAHGGVEGVLEITRYFVDRLRVATPFLAFLRGEPDTAARVLFGGPAGVHRRAVRAQGRILLEVGGENGTAAFDRAALDQVAFLYVRIVESAIYAELLGGAPLDPDLVERAARTVLLRHR